MTKIQVYWNSGIPTCVTFYKGKNISINKYYYPDGSISCVYHYKGYKKHRLEGPSYIEYNEDGSIRYEEFWIDGEYLDPLEFYCRVGGMEVK